MERNSGQVAHITPDVRKREKFPPLLPQIPKPFLAFPKTIKRELITVAFLKSVRTDGVVAVHVVHSKTSSGGGFA